MSPHSKHDAPQPPADPVPEKAAEWQDAKRWNPFNSNKLLAHVERWKRIRRGRLLPAPALITVTPSIQSHTQLGFR